jgi:hypothetical protein
LQNQKQKQKENSICHCKAAAPSAVLLLQTKLQKHKQNYANDSSTFVRSLLQKQKQKQV